MERRCTLVAGGVESCLLASQGRGGHRWLVLFFPRFGRAFTSEAIPEVPRTPSPPPRRTSPV